MLRAYNKATRLTISFRALLMSWPVLSKVALVQEPFVTGSVTAHETTTIRHSTVSDRVTGIQTIHMSSTRPLIRLHRETSAPTTGHQRHVVHVSIRYFVSNNLCPGRTTETCPSPLHYGACRSCHITCSDVMAGAQCDAPQGTVV